MNLTVGQIVWARRNQDEIYWPGKITIISNNTNDLWSSELHYNYLVQFFVTNQSVWITDILPYRQYKDSMTNDSFMHYGLHPTIKQDFLNAISQADYASSQQIYTNSNDLTSMTMMTTQQQQQQKLLPLIEDNTDNDFLLTPSPMFTSNTGNYGDLKFFTFYVMHFRRLRKLLEALKNSLMSTLIEIITKANSFCNYKSS
jgi:hypothetical protein